MKTASLVASVSRKAGGLFESVRRLHQELARLPGVSVRVLSLQDRFTAEDVKSWAPLPVQTFRILGPAPFGFSPKLKKAMLDLDEEILHTHGIWMYPSVATRNWHRQTGRPYLISPHGMLDPWAVQNSAWKKRIALRLYEGEHLRNAACIRALCPSEAESIRKFGLKNPICVIPNGIDMPELQDHGTVGPWDHQTLLRSNGVSVIDALKAEGRKVLLYLGRIHPKKGLANLLRAWSEVQKNRNTEARAWVLAIAGWDQGGHEQQLLELCSELGVPVFRCSRSASSEGRSHCDTEKLARASAVFLGPQFNQDKDECYRNCDAFVLPSFSEGLPMTVLEAWAYGKPVMMTSACNLPEGFAAGAALCTDPGTESISNTLRDLFRTPDSALRNLGGNGRVLVAERFGWPKIAREMKGVYGWVLGSGPKPSCVL